MSQMINKLVEEIEKIYDANPGLREVLDEIREKELTAEEMFKKLGYAKVKSDNILSILFYNRGISVQFGVHSGEYIVYAGEDEAVIVSADLHEAISKQLEEMRYIS